MAATITGFQAPQTKSFTFDVMHNSIPYKLKLKINLVNTQYSTGSLATDSKMYKLNKKCIFWEGTENVPSKKVPKLVKQAAASNLLDVVLTNTSNGDFEVRIIIKPSESKQSPSDLTLSQNSKGINHQFFRDNSKARNAVLEQMVNLFTETNSLQRSVTEQILDVFEYLDSINQERIVKAIIENSCLQQTVMTIQFLLPLKDYDFLIKQLLEGLIKNILHNSLIFQEDLKLFTLLFADLGFYYQEYFIGELFTRIQLPNRGPFQNITEIFSCIQRGCYTLTSHRRSMQSGLSPSFPEKFNPNRALELIYNGISQFEKVTSGCDSSYIICCLTGVIATMEILISSGVTYWGNSALFDKIYNILKLFCAKKFLHKKNPHDLYANYQVSFLAKFALQLLKMTGKTPDSSYSATRHAFYSIKGIVTAASIFVPNTAWGILAGVLDAAEDFGKAFKVKDSDLSSYFYLSLFQNSYLGTDPQCLEDFKRFADELLEPSKENENKKRLPVHSKPFFVAGLIELLYSMFQFHRDGEIIRRVVHLLWLIERNNHNNTSTEEPLFKIKPKKPYSNAGTYIGRKISETFKTLEGFKAGFSKPLMEDPIAIEKKVNEAIPPTHLFEAAFYKTFPWIERLQNTQLIELNHDKQLIEDGPYIIDLKSSSRGIVGNLKDQLNDKLRSKNLILITGDSGSGKTLFLKQYTQHLLTNYKPGDPLPFYFPLRSFRGLEGNLIQSILKKYCLETYEDELRKIPIILFLDAFDEMFFGTNKSPSNIYMEQQFEKWPNAQLVFTCRQNMLQLGDEQRYFAPPGKIPELLFVLPLGTDEIERFFTKYIGKTKKLSSPWDLERYKDSIDKLGLKTIIQTPYYLRQIADTLPGIDVELSSKIEGSQSIEKQEKEFLLDLLVSHIIKREVSKTVCMGVPIFKPSEYLNFLLRVGWLMHICEVTTVPEKISKNETEPERARARNRAAAQIEKARLEEELTIVDKEKVADIEDELSRINHQLNSIECQQTAEDELQKLLYDQSYAHFRGGGLMKYTPIGIEFSHLVIFEYLLELNRDSLRKRKLLQMIDSNND